MLIHRPNAPIESSIIVQTRMGRQIPNYQSHEFTAFELNQFRDIDRDYPLVTFRTPANPVYNCHGLTFASKRTGIYDSPALRTILEDDGFTEVERGKVLPGDVILYFADDGDIEHSGIVVSAPDEQLRVPLIVSKWGRYKEAVHWAHMCPYNYAHARYFRVTR